MAVYEYRVLENAPNGFEVVAVIVDGKKAGAPLMMCCATCHLAIEGGTLNPELDEHGNETDIYLPPKWFLEKWAGVKKMARHCQVTP